MRIIGITGGIGTGKSTVSRYLRDRGYDVVDADGIAKELASDPSVLAEIRDYFGDGVITSDGILDRKRMASLVFSDLGKKEMLESIITSRVIQKTAGIIENYREGRLSPAKNDTVFLDAPTLFETGADRICDEIWLVTCSLETRMERAAKRDASTREDLEARIAAQMPESEKAARSDEVIYNDGSKEELSDKIDQLLSRLEI